MSKKYECPYCDRTFLIISRFEDHLVIKHGLDEVSRMKIVNKQTDGMYRF